MSQVTNDEQIFIPDANYQYSQAEFKEMYERIVRVGKLLGTAAPIIFEQCPMLAEENSQQDIWKKNERSVHKNEPKHIERHK
jgi:hypothetical protein